MCDEIMDSILNDKGTISKLPVKELRKLERYCKTPAAGATFSKAHIQTILGALNQYLSSIPTESDANSSDNHHEDPTNLRNFKETLEATDLRLFHELSLPENMDTVMLRCLRLTRAYYSSLLTTYVTTRHRSNIVPLAIEIVSNPYTSGNDQSMYNTFWQDLRTAIYFLKPDPILGQNSYHRARPLLTKVGSVAHQICAQQPLALLKDIFLNISPANLSMWSAGYATLLKLLKDVLNRQDRLQNLLWQLLHYLWVNAGLSCDFNQKLLGLIVDDATKALSPNDPEIFELQWAQVKFLRRSGDHANAQLKCSLLIAATERKSGRNSSSTRLALSEMIYLHSSQNNLHLAEKVAKDVIERGRRHLGPSYPDAQCIYSMEDIAEVLEKQGVDQNLVRSRQWLEQAYAYAVRLWGADKQPTAHILDKLQALRNRGA